MHVIKFDYQPFLQFDQKTSSIYKVYRPIVPIKLSAHHRIYKYTIESILDSGADYNLFPAAIGESLGLVIKKGEKSEHMGIGNVGITAYTHTVKIFVGNYSFQSKIDFSFDHKIPLLGRQWFFKFFQKITFYEKQQCIELEY